MFDDSVKMGFSVNGNGVYGPNDLDLLHSVGYISDGLYNSLKAEVKNNQQSNN